MANERIPNDPYRTGLSDDYYGRPQRFDNEMQVDPELQEGPASSSKIALFAVGLALVLGAVFYGLNNTSIKDAQTSPPAQTAQTQSTQPQAPPGMRDVTPKANTGANTGANTAPGMTTGAATNRASPPQSSPQGTEAPSANNNDNK
jgi:hypothetical protein